MSRFELLVGAEAFWRRAEADIALARRRLFVQAMTFEGDRSGLAVAAAIGASAAADRRVLVDAYTSLVVSDRFVFSPVALLDRAHRAEVRATKAMFQRLRQEGAGVRLTNPVGPLALRYPARNHKKLIVADDAAYLGGINFSDHNFAWHDFMVRIGGAPEADFLAEDFLATWNAAPRPARAEFPGLVLASLDGRSNAAAFAEVIGLVDAARDEITVLSPYLTFPFIAPLARARSRGVGVRLITPLANNKPLVRDALLAAAARAGFDVRLSPEMTHLKGLLIDGAHLVVGSANFDFVSWAAEEEYLAILSEPGLLDDFRSRIIDPALVEARAPARRRAVLAAAWAEGILRLGSLAARGARTARRGATDWPG
ncbi:MAG: phospholipase D-like domain-containing protein [Caulobacteraceae bacterium]